MRESSVEATSPAISEIATPTAAAVRSMGRKRTAPASTNRFLQGHALLTAQLDEVHEDDGVPDDDASARDETNHGYGSEERAHRGVRRQDANKDQGIGAMMSSGVLKDLNHRQPGRR